MPRTQAPSAAALTFEITPIADGAQLLIPDGEFRSSDGSGRPLEVPAWRLNAELAARIIAARQARGVDLVIDYEHSTVLKAKNGDKAPAAGWVSADALEYRPGVGLVARAPQWTPVARAHLDAREYRYGSPVILYDPRTGDVTGLHSFALTNDPGLSGVNTALSALFQETPLVNPLLAALIASLGLPAGTTDDAVITAVTALKAKADQADTEIATLRAAPADPAKYVPMALYSEAQASLAAANKSLAELTTKAREAEVDALIASVPDKITPAASAHFRAVGLQNIETLRAVIAALPSNPALAGGTQTNGQPPAGAEGAAALSAAEKEICRAMNISEADYLKTKKAEA